MSKNKFNTSFPTVPVPDQFGNVFMHLGFSKLEYATLQIAAARCNGLKGQVISESILSTIVSESIFAATTLLEKCEEIANKAAQEENKTIHTIIKRGE